MTVVKLGLLAGVLMVVFLLSLNISMRMATRATEVVVPTVFRVDMEQARERLEAVGLGMEVAGEVYDASIPNGAVVSQLPTPGERIKASGRVKVMVSLGVQHSPVPDLIGSTQRVARLMTQQSGYEIGHTSEIFLADVESDQIIRQVPNPGSATVLTARVDVVLAHGDGLEAGFVGHTGLLRQCGEKGLGRLFVGDLGVELDAELHGVLLCL